MALRRKNSQLHLCRIGAAHTFKTTIRHPHLYEDQYMCTSAEMTGGVEYIVNFEALAFAERTHHLLVYGCETPASIAPWDCRGICQGSSGPKIIYAWARNAPPTRMPPDVGFEVGYAGVKSLVVQIHYKRPVAPNEPADTSGVRLTLSKQRQKYIAGIFLLFRYDLLIPPKTAVTHGDISCKYTGVAELYPFGFRVHAHSLSPVISAYQNNGSWSLLGKGNPQWPQAFYPIQDHPVIKKGDLLFARCTYDSSNRGTTTRIGGNHDDEMCNFYMMYYTDAQVGQSYLMCSGNDYQELFKTIPPGNDVRLPPNAALDEQAAPQPKGNHGHVAEGIHEVPAGYGHIGDILHGQLTDSQTSDRQGQLPLPLPLRDSGQLSPRDGLSTDTRSRYLRLFDHEEPPNRFDYYGDYLRDDTGADKATDPDYFYYEVQHQRSRNRNRNKPHQSSQDGGGPSYLGSYGGEEDRYRGDNIHGLDGAHAFFGFPDVKDDDSDYPREKSNLGLSDSQRTNAYSLQEHGTRLGNSGGGSDAGIDPRYGAQVEGGRPSSHYNSDTMAPRQGASLSDGAPSGRLRNQFGRGRIGGVGHGSRGGGGGRGTSGGKSFPTNTPVQTHSPTPSAVVVTAAPVLANKEVSSLASSAIHADVIASKPLLTGGPSVEEAAGWPALVPEDHVVLGQVSGIGVDMRGNVYVFHRASRVWGHGSFDMMNKMRPSVGPIKENTIITFNPQGKVINQWGAGMFYMPHGLHVDHEDNVWVTDVGLHQVFKFNKGSTTPSLTLGTRLDPGKDNRHFCKPTDVATLTTGEFFVTDGYCNTRILKYAKNGTLLAQWGTKTKGVGADSLPPASSFDIPHSVTAVEWRGWVCVADRENGRIQCFTTAGKFVKQFHQKEFSGRLFAITYSNITDTLYAVNGPGLYNNEVPVRGFSLHPDTGGLMEMWAPKQGLQNPHDLSVSPQGDFIYIAELDPHRVWRMYVHKEILEAQKHKKGGLLSRPGSVAGTMGGGEPAPADKGDLGASLIIGALLVVPVIFIVAVTVFMRLRKNDKSGYKKAKLLLRDDDFDDEGVSLS